VFRGSRSKNARTRAFFRDWLLTLLSFRGRSAFFATSRDQEKSRGFRRGARRGAVPPTRTPGVARPDRRGDSRSVRPWVLAMVQFPERTRCASARLPPVSHGSLPLLRESRWCYTVFPTFSVPSPPRSTPDPLPTTSSHRPRAGPLRERGRSRLRPRRV
jgi:hypothetical protein